MTLAIRAWVYVRWLPGKWHIQDGRAVGDSPRPIVTLCGLWRREADQATRIAPGEVCSPCLRTGALG